MATVSRPRPKARRPVSKTAGKLVPASALSEHALFVVCRIVDGVEQPQSDLESLHGAAHAIATHRLYGHPAVARKVIGVVLGEEVSLTKAIKAEEVDADEQSRKYTDKRWSRTNPCHWSHVLRRNQRNRRLARQSLREFRRGQRRAVKGGAA